MNTIDERYQEGCLLFELNKQEKAKEIFLHILEEAPDYYQALNKIGVIYANSGDLDKAQKYFEQALDTNKGYAPALVNLGNIFKESGDYEDAEKFYLEAIDEDPDYAIAYHNIAVIYKERNLYDAYMKYIKEYRRAYRRNSYNRDAGIKGKSSRKAGMVLNITLAISLAVFVLILVSNN